MFGKKIKKRVMAWLLALCMMTTMLPAVQTLAADAVDEGKTTTKTITYCDTKGFENFEAGEFVDGQLDGSGYGHEQGRAKFTVEQNKYLLCETTAATGDYNWVYENAAMNAITGDMVVEFDIATSSSFPNGNLQYRDTSKAASALVRFNGKTLTFGDKTLDVEAGEWTHVKVVCNVSEKKYDVYVNNAEEPIVTDFATNSANVQLVRFYITNGTEIGTNIMVDNFKITSGETTYCDTLGFENFEAGEFVDGQLDGSGYGHEQGRAKFTVEQNKYLLCETTAATGDYNWVYENASMNAITGDMVVEFDIATSSSFPNGNLQYRDTSKAASALVRFNGKTLTFGDKTLDVEAGEWTHVKVVCNVSEKKYDVYVNNAEEPIVTDFATNSANVQLVRFYITNGTEIGTNLMLDNLKITGEVEAQEVTVGDAVHYNSGGYEKVGQRPGGNNKNNTIAIVENSDATNHYLLLETTEDGAASDYHWDLEFEDKTDYMVFDFEVSTSGILPTGYFLYRDTDKVGTYLMQYSDNTLTFGNGTETYNVTLTPNEWEHVVIVCNIPERSYAVYVGDDVYSEGAQPVLEYTATKGPTSIALFRMYYNADNAVGTNMMMDNLKIYEGTTPRDIGNDPMLNSTSKIDMTNTDAKNALGNDVVALSVGGNGIYYDGNKQAMEAPAYVDENGNICIPVNAVAAAFDLTGEWYGSAEIVTTDNVQFIKLSDLSSILNKTISTDDTRGIIIFSDSQFAITDTNANVINNYLLYDRPTQEQIKTLFEQNNTQNNENRHPRVMINQEIYDKVVFNYANDADVKAWGDKIIADADEVLKKAMPTYSLPDNYRLLTTCRDVYQRSQTLSMAYILTKDSEYAEGLYDVFEAAGNFPDWNQQHFLDVAEMTAAFAIGYDWLYDYWSDDQKEFLAEKIYEYGLVPAYEAYYGNLGSDGWWTPGNHTNWNVVCNGGMLMGAVALFEQYPEMCSDMIAMQIRDVETMMKSFYPDGAWAEGISYWEYTLSYTVNMLSTLEACFGTDFNLSKAPGLTNSINYHMAGDGSTGLNNFHDTHVTHGSVNTYFWLSNKYNQPGVTNVRLYHFANDIADPTAFDLLWYDTSIKGTDFDMALDTYIKGVELVSMRNSWTDDNGAWLSYHGGVAVENHSHLDTGSFVFDLAGIRWATDLGADNYDMDGYFDGTKKHVYYRLRPEGHNLYVINPSEDPGQTLDHFATATAPISGERGAYSVLDLTSAYATWVEDAQRGYMLADDRRSGIVRDEITFKDEGSEFWWFMNTPLEAEIEVVDKNTAYITKDGITLKFMIDSDITDYEFGVMDAKPLDTSPNPAGQLKNEGMQKLYLKGTAGKQNYVVCKMILADDPCAENELKNTKIADWTIPSGELQQVPVLDNIFVNGTALKDFNPTTIKYERTVRYDDTSTPVITATAAEGLDIEVIYGDTYTDTIKIKVTDQATGLYRVYNYNTTVMSQLFDVTVGDTTYERMQIVGHKASDEPEDNHPATKVSDNDTDAESRWAAENKVWLELEMDDMYSIDAVGISVWKGDQRSYNFKIEVSEDGKNWTEVIAERSTDTANGADIGIYMFENGAIDARYVRYSGNGNSFNAWNSITELAVLKTKVADAPTATPTATPTVTPTATPTVAPTATPAATPAATPTLTATPAPTDSPAESNDTPDTTAEPDTMVELDTPNTGDNSNPLLWVILFVACVLGLGGIVVYKKRKGFLNR